MKIEIIGINTINGLKLKKKVIEIANCIDGKITINLIEEYNIPNLPLLYINNKLITQGNVPPKKEIVKYLKNNYKE